MYYIHIGIGVITTRRSKFSLIAGLHVLILLHTIGKLYSYKIVLKIATGLYFPLKSVTKLSFHLDTIMYRFPMIFYVIYVFVYSFIYLYILFCLSYCVVVVSCTGCSCNIL